MPPTPLRPEELFKAEKARTTSAAKSLHARLLAEAKAAFDKLMAEGQAARKSGRPRKHPLPPLRTGSALRQPSPPPRFVGASPAPVFRPVSPVPAADKAAMVKKERAKAKSRAKARPKAKAKKKKR